MFGTSSIFSVCIITVLIVLFVVASLLGALFLRGVGIVGHSKADEARDMEQAEAPQSKGEA